MKTTKVILVGAIMVFSTIGFAQKEVAPIDAKPSQDLHALISVKAAMQNFGLYRAMRAQLTPGFLQVEQPSYTVTVRYNHSVYYINGTYKDWCYFFSIRRYPAAKKG